MRGATVEVVGLLFAMVFLYALYHVIRTGVRDGLKEALQDHTIGVRANETDQ